MNHNTLENISNTISCDFIILTALRPEFDAVCSVLSTHIKERVFDTILGEVVTISLPAFDDDNRLINGIVVLIDGIGRVHSALTTASVLRKYRTNCIMLVGIAGGFEANGVHIGDVIVSTEIIDYAINKIIPSGLEFRPYRYAISPDLLRIAKKLSKMDKYLYTHDAKLIGRVHIGPIASGDQIFASSNAIKVLLKEEPLLLGVEMEGAGVAAAAFHENPPVRFIVVRGVADLANELKSDKWIDVACLAAAKFAVDFLNHSSANYSGS